MSGIRSDLGLRGGLQVQYNYGASVEDARRKLEHYDLFYLKNMSILFDIAIIFHTVRTIVSGTRWALKGASTGIEVELGVSLDAPIMGPISRICDPSPKLRDRLR